MCDGWDIVHAGSGKRLEVDGNGSVVLTDKLSSYCHWDILHPFFGATHFPNFWTPHFFASPFNERFDIHSLSMEAMQGVINPYWKYQGGPALRVEDAKGRIECIKACADSVACSLALTGPNNQCVLFNGQVVPIENEKIPLTILKSRDHTRNNQPWIDVPSQVHGDWILDYIMLAHRIYGDTKDRYASKEFNANWLKSAPTESGNLIRKYSTGIAVKKNPDRQNSIDGNNNAYRDCLVNFGVDSKRCRDYLQRITTLSNPISVQKNILGGPAGVCNGPNLRSALCQGFCKELDAKNSEACTSALKEHCKGQTEPGRQEPMCSCFMPSDTYIKAWETAVDSVTDRSPDAAAFIKSAVRKTQNPSQGCWYVPCRDSLLNPNSITSDCNSEINVCYQVQGDNKLENNSQRDGGLNFLSQQCTFLDGSGKPSIDPREDAGSGPAKPPPGAGSQDPSLPGAGPQTPSNGDPNKITGAIQSILDRQKQLQAMAEEAGNRDEEKTENKVSFWWWMAGVGVVLLIFTVLAVLFTRKS